MKEHRELKTCQDNLLKFHSWQLLSLWKHLKSRLEPVGASCRRALLPFGVPGRALRKGQGAILCLLSWWSVSRSAGLQCKLGASLV